MLNPRDPGLERLIWGVGGSRDRKTLRDVKGQRNSGREMRNLRVVLKSRIIALIEEADPGRFVMTDDSVTAQDAIPAIYDLPTRAQSRSADTGVPYP